MIRYDEAKISVVRDGASSWCCEVEWPDGQVVTRDVEFFMFGFPEIVVTTEDEALKALEESVRAHPERWRR